jgi:hypothetical protein
MTLHVRRGSRQSGCPTLQNEHNQTWALVFAPEGQATAQARAETIAASVNFLQAYGPHLHDLLCEVALTASLPDWVTLAAEGLGSELGGVLGTGAEAEIDSRGDAAVARKAGRR